MHILVVFQAFVHLLLQYSSASRLPLVHRDHHNLSFKAPMKRDAMHIASLTRRLDANETSGFNTSLQLSDNVYWAEVGVGTPPQKQRVLIDTGSDVSWVKCRCDLCTFDPNNSTSFVDVLCNDTTCNYAKSSNWGCGNLDLPCTYDFIYEDRTKIHGSMAMESITIGSTTVPNVPIGCSDMSGGVFDFSGADGILGLGGGSLSLVRQSAIGGVFSYCLGTGGWLGFGFENVPRDALWAPLIYNPLYPSFYYINLVEISLGGEVLDIPSDTFQVNPDTGEGGMVLDTGTAVTRLAQGAYVALRDKFKEKMGNDDFFGGGDGTILDTCYYQGFNPHSVPAILFNISSRGMDPPTIILKAKNVLLQSRESKYCLAFASSDQSFGILGNLQQQGSQITIEGTRRYVGFGPGVC